MDTASLSPTPDGKGRTVTRRRVFYLAGFDPRGAEHYHQTYVEQAARQSETEVNGSGVQYRVSGLTPDGEHVWSWKIEAVRAEDASTRVETLYSFLAWDDIARKAVPMGWPVALGALWRLWSEHLLQGGHAVSMRLAPRWAWSLMSLPIFGFLVALLSGLGAAGVAAAANAFGVGLVATTLLSTVAALLLLWFGWRLALRWNLVWLTHALVGSYDWTAGRLPALDQRLEAFVQRIFDDFRQSDADEVVVVGHCMGSMLGAWVLDRVAMLCDEHGCGMQRLKFLTLASPMANYALLKHDRRTAPAVRSFATRPIDWLDYTAPGDPLCYVLVDVMKELGIDASARRVNFRMRSSRFDKMFDAAELRKVRHDPLRMHFQYLLASTKPVDNDFCALTAGRRSIASRIQESMP
jgi:hypothetical protein